MEATVTLSEEARKQMSKELFDAVDKLRGYELHNLRNREEAENSSLSISVTASLIISYASKLGHTLEPALEKKLSTAAINGVF